MEDIAKQHGIAPAADSTEDIRVNFTKKATWLWKEKEIAITLQSLDSFKTTFTLALSGETLKGVKDVTKSMNKMDISQRHRNILKWLKVTDPSVNHAVARLKHETGY